MADLSGNNIIGSRQIHMDLPDSDSGGASLRAARLERGIEIADIAAELRIPKNYLLALENETYDDLPGTTYGFGYIRSYCQLLGLDAQPYLDTFKMRMARTSSQLVHRFPDEVLEPRMSGAMAAMLLVLVMLSGYIGWQVLDAYDVNPLTKEDAPIQLVTSAPTDPVINSDASEEIVTVIVTKDSGDDSEQVAEATSEEATIEEVASEEAEEPITITQTEQDEAPVASEAPVIVAEAEPAAQPEETTAAATEADTQSVIDTPATEVAGGTASAQATARQPADEIVISSVAPSWVEVVRENGDVILSKLFKPGDQYISPADEKLYLSTGNAGGLVLTIPGLEEFSAGQVGEIIRDLPLSRDSLRSRRSATANN